MLTHKVQPGESLSKIRTKYGLEFVPFGTIKKLNPQIKDINIIQPGWEIKLPTSLAELKALKRIPAYKPPKLFKPPKREVFGSEYGPGIGPPPPGLKASRAIEEKLIPEPEEVIEQKKPLQKVFFKKAPGLKERIKSEITWKLSEIFKGEPREISALKTETAKMFPLTPSGERTVKGIEVKRSKPEEEIVGKWSADPSSLFKQMPMSSKERIGILSKKKIKNVIKEIRQIFRIGPEALYWDPAGKITLGVDKNEVLMHEALHDTFQANIVIPFKEKGIIAFNKAWNKAKIDYPWETAIVDQVIADRYGKINPVSRAHERYAWFGCIFGRGGLKNFPKALQPYYSMVFH